ncbi:hypothetical protein DERP_014404 [Dermatophagoides pteronyssinus]|uniref:Uncharacterized protein n=1 Tax=Dermatophagoides pteronyssinus TaxID=6956 RepID=A0ABQ8J6H0_DERPT|nr:hypothetical protein DERP_014404 [Dermatophagoides pteronyssinus]
MNDNEEKQIASSDTTINTRSTFRHQKKKNYDKSPLSSGTKTDFTLFPHSLSNNFYLFKKI